MLIEFDVSQKLSERQVNGLATCIRQLLLCDFELQTAARLAELRDGGEIRNPFRISVDLRHLPSEVDLGGGQSLVIAEGQRLSRAEVIEIIQHFVPPGLVADVRVAGVSWNDLREASDQQVVGEADME